MKILIIRAGALGDTLMLIPSISNLKNDAEIIIAGRRPGIDYLRPYVDRCIDIETSGWHVLFSEGVENVPDLSLPGIDHVIAFLNDTEGKLAPRLRSWFPGSGVSVFPVFPREGDRDHVALYMAKALREAGIPIDAERAFEDSVAKPLISPLKPGAGERHGIVIHPGSGSTRKNYPPAFWLEVIRGLQNSGPAEDEGITLLFGPAEEGLLQLFQEDLTEGDAVFKVMPEREDLLSILSNASVYIGHDSGITHLAAMMGIHVIALFKESSIEQWRPLGPKVQVVQGQRLRAQGNKREEQGLKT